jgi:hypothetical protein
MSSDTPVSLVPERGTIISDVEQLAMQAHEFICRDRPTTSEISTEWVTLCRKMKRRLEQLRQTVDEVPAELWDIVLAGKEGAGLGIPPGIWRVYEARRHAKVLERIAQIKATIAGLPPPGHGLYIIDADGWISWEGAPRGCRVKGEIEYPLAREMAHNARRTLGDLLRVIGVISTDTNNYFQAQHRLNVKLANRQAPFHFRVREGVAEVVAGAYTPRQRAASDARGRRRKQ